MKWFQNWFNSPYYHILYHQRNDAEAEFFMDNLCMYLEPTLENRLLDIACGKGRHAIYLNKKGYDIIGIDISAASIHAAKAFENKKLQFFIHDMRKPFYVNYFQYAFNLFTSFGYFDTEKDHVKALTSFAAALQPNGILVIDYFNAIKIKACLTHQEQKHIDGITFNIYKKIEDHKIVKSIRFEHQEKSFAFKEEVQDFDLTDFERILKLAHFSIERVFGGYDLQPFVEKESDRLVMICRKIA